MKLLSETYFERKYWNDCVLLLICIEMVDTWVKWFSSVLTWFFNGVNARVMTFAVRRVLCAKPGGLNLLLRVFDTTAKSCQMM